MTKVPSLWASVARLTACGFIFVYHYFVLTGQDTRGLGTLGLYIFFFLAGWFSARTQKTPWEWFKGRVRRLMVPYWPVIFVVLIANRVVGYKETTLINDILTFFGLSLFVKNPVYVISWFITILLLLDLSLLGVRLIKYRSAQAVFLACCGFLLYSRYPKLINAFYLFYLGLMLNALIKGRITFSLDEWMTGRFSWYGVINDKLFSIQNYTYSFFLIHGAVLIYVVRVLKLDAVSTFLLALPLSMVGAFVHNRAFRKFS
ncbi:MAG TPA: acyltransferase family protein [Candidatus Bathyarchaeia archaeon]|nr:acyltransferase family protein [Candidatus Bathyarchaeia archaeon]